MLLVLTFILQSDVLLVVLYPVSPSELQCFIPLAINIRFKKNTAAVAVTYVSKQRSDSGSGVVISVVLSKTVENGDG
jgi:hypothetical protein